MVPIGPLCSSIALLYPVRYQILAILKALRSCFITFTKGEGAFFSVLRCFSVPEECVSIHIYVLESALHSQCLKGRMRVFCSERGVQMMFFVVGMTTNISAAADKIG